MLSADESTRFANFVARRAAFEPIQYILGAQEFFGLPFVVTPDVLIPRPETEHLVEAVFERVTPQADTHILDVGTGSGAIAIACAKALPRARVDALDVSAAALAVCRRNLRKLRLTSRVEPLRSDHFAAVGRRRYDIIVSNPPYVGAREMRGLPREYTHEPALGLASGVDGLNSVRAILGAAPGFLRPGGLLVVEVGNSERAVLRAFPRLPFIWPEIAMGGGGVFLLRAEDLEESQESGRQYVR